jgi:hypothetical protein
MQALIRIYLNRRSVDFPGPLVQCRSIHICERRGCGIAAIDSLRTPISYTPEGYNPRDKDVYAMKVALDAFRLVDIPQRSPQVGVLVLMPNCQLGRFGHGCKGKLRARHLQTVHSRR